MCQERSQAIASQPDERADARLCQVNGFKPESALTRVAGYFPNEACLRRGVSTCLAEPSDEGETGKV